MLALVLTKTPARPLSPGDFAAELQAGELRLPHDLAQALQRLSVRNVVDLVSTMHAFPSAVAQELGWSVQDVAHARQQLIAALEGQLPAQLLHPPARPRMGSGAHPPRPLPRR